HARHVAACLHMCVSSELQEWSLVSASPHRFPPFSGFSVNNIAILNNASRNSLRIPTCPPPSRQAVIDSLASYRDWTFLYSSNVRQAATANNTREYDDKQSVAASFASLLIASQADVFIGTLGSNWSRLMNELRSTNGRLFNPFIALNDGEW
ncbi:unnamed protein product, partial [Closterium sp. NIES-53]